MCFSCPKFLIKINISFGQCEHFDQVDLLKSYGKHWSFYATWCRMPKKINQSLWLYDTFHDLVVRKNHELIIVHLQNISICMNCKFKVSKKLFNELQVPHVHCRHVPSSPLTTFRRCSSPLLCASCMLFYKHYQMKLWHLTNKNATKTFINFICNYIAT
jgi:hypothetical protein